jgi:hypothetical protein
MSVSAHRLCAVVALVALLVGASWSGSVIRAEDKKPEEKKPAIVLPKDPKTVVLTYDPGAGGFVRKGEAPQLKIQADGQVTSVSPFDGTKKEGKLTAKELDELLRFVIQDKDFLSLTKEKIDAGINAAAAATGKFIAVGGAGTSAIMVENDGKKHEVSFRGASLYLQAYPKVDPLARYAAIEKRLSDLAQSVGKGK